MYIPTQKERYSKVAGLTLFLCVMLPSGIVAWLGDVEDLLSCMCAFLWPVAQPLVYLGFTQMAAFIISAILQAFGFFAMLRSKKLSSKAKLTIAITWGMSFALILRVLIAFETWRQVTGQ